MYKVLLCWRYLRTRYLALACIISVTLGVATLIVVNSVMAGFSEKLRNSLHFLLADIIIESHGIEGFTDPKGKMNRILADPFLADRIEAMSESLECAAMMQYTSRHSGETITRPIKLVGIDANTRSELGGFEKYLMNKDRPQRDFSLPAEVERRWRERAEVEVKWNHELRHVQQPAAGIAPVELLPPQPPEPHRNNGDSPPPPPAAPPPLQMEDIKIPSGAIVGQLVAGFRYENKLTGQAHVYQHVEPGDSFVLFTVKGVKLEPAYDRFVLVDHFKTEMAEYDGNVVYVDLKYLQELRAMSDTVTHIQIKLKRYQDAPAVVEKLNELFKMGYRVQTWEQRQGSLLAAIEIEKGILNVLLFLIIAVAGFGILAIFSMIVTEKTRDIGILKSLGASNTGVMQIFLSYGLLLGLVGSTFGTILGVALTQNLNPVERTLSSLTGRHVFDPSIYMFNEIPTFIDPLMVTLVNIGAVAIAVVFSILPALRAAMLHPVRALRYE